MVLGNSGWHHTPLYVCGVCVCLSPEVSCECLVRSLSTYMSVFLLCVHVGVLVEARGQHQLSPPVALHPIFLLGSLTDQRAQRLARLASLTINAQPGKKW